MFERSRKGEQALLIQPHAGGPPDDGVLEEFADLARSAGANVVALLQARIEGSAQNTEMLNVRSGTPRTTIITSAAPVDNLQVQVIRDETELEGVRRARDSVLANISHEFRTPLAAQLASIELNLQASQQLKTAETLAMEAAVIVQKPPHPLSIWLEAQTKWQQAVNLLQTIPENATVASTAQQKLQSYQSNYQVISKRVELAEKV